MMLLYKRLLVLVVCGVVLTLISGAVKAAAKTSALSDEPIPLQIEAVGERVKPLVEIGDTFLGNGNIDAGFTLPTGAVWQPNLLIWGNLRSAVSVWESEPQTGDEHVTEWANRLDLFGQISLSQTDRIVVAMRPLDDDGEFSGYQFHPETESVSGFNTEVSVAFFEANLAELFPRDSNGGGRAWDLDLSVGRLPWLFQEGTMVNDRMDSIALSRNNILWVPGATNTRATLIYGWDEVNRHDNREDESAKMYGFFTETDFPWSTVNFDVTHVSSDRTGDGWYAGVSASQRIGKLNTAFRFVQSYTDDRETLQTRRGSLAVAELSWTPPYTHDNVYTNFFWAFDEFTSAARDDAAGGPLALVGILYAATGLGRFASALDNDAIKAYGGAVGYQAFFNQSRSQLIVEAGFRDDTDGTDRTQVALGARYQKALGKHYVVRLDAFLSGREDADTGWGSRVELLVKF